ncbi:MAG: 23S rRNA (adenine(2503)-C(2))-methyltransferase RlmN, partial [Candidatus Hydrogenedentes bacterium]|nr:23S rRNA (adenine(2503)-C(2))-methyltransferase RlmN [Candidatus Hydrogenedentota bacterium]
SIRLLMAKDGLNLGARRITVSTAGDVPGINRFAQENRQVRLSVSLHAANDALRSELVPLNRKYPLPALIAAVNDYIAQTGRQVTFEWALLKDTNDSEKDADELLILAQKSKAHVNLIPYNPVTGLAYERPADSTCAMFARRLEAGGVSVTLRKERGQDIDAACGQLRRRASEAT